MGEPFKERFPCTPPNLFGQRDKTQPECPDYFVYNGKYYLYTADGKKEAVCYCIADRPDGPYYEPDDKKLLKCGVVTIDENDKILDMTEKSPTPATHWCCPPFYYYTRQDAKLVAKGIEAGCGTDAPGSYIAWLCTQTPVFAMEMPGKRFDVGNLESYNKIKEEYKGITVC